MREILEEEWTKLPTYKMKIGHEVQHLLQSVLKVLAMIEVDEVLRQKTRHFRHIRTLSEAHSGVQRKTPECTSRNVCKANREQNRCKISRICILTSILPEKAALACWALLATKPFRFLLVSSTSCNGSRPNTFAEESNWAERRSNVSSRWNPQLPNSWARYITQYLAPDNNVCATMLTWAFPRCSFLDDRYGVFLKSFFWNECSIFKWHSRYEML